MLGGLADGSGFTAAEISEMSIEDVKFWWNCVMAYRKHVQDMSEN